MNRYPAAALTLCLAAFAGAAAAGPAMKEGQWEMTIQSKMEGMPMQPPPMTFKHCYTDRDVADGRRIVEQQNSKNGKCEMVDFKESGNTVTYSMKCQTPQGDSFTKGSSTYKGDSYTGTMHIRMNMQGQKMEMTQVHNGKRLGACKAS
ncbi:MAG: DUF3617 family protein [Betaproteobacteria bacterium]|nr:DUF3617 family protein [Betaproteobacteria bacterium]